MTNVPGISYTDAGFVAPAESVILTGVLADYNAAFGGNLNITNLETPQGQKASSDAAIIADNYDQQCTLFNSVDPAFASGRMQDAIGRIYFITRLPAQPSTTVATLSGQGPASPTAPQIPVGALAQDTNGNIWAATESGTLPSGGGTISLTFACVTNGPIALPAGALNAIYQSIPGWDSITNPADGVPGNDVETRTAFEARRAQSVAINSKNTIQAIQGNVLDVPGVLDAYTISNNTGGPVTIGDYTLLPNSIYCAAIGGDATAVAQAIFKKGPPGIPYNGNTTITVEDTNSGYEEPYPAYQIKFEIPSNLTILFAVVLKNSSLVPSNAAALVQAAIASAFVGGDGGPRARIASEIFASRFYSAVAAIGSWVQIVSIQIGTVTANQSTVTVGIDQVPVTNSGSIGVSFV